MLKINNPIKMVISDFDGVFTDNGLYVSEDGITSKKMNFLDIMATYMLRRAGIRVAIISGDESAALQHLKKRYEVEDVFGGIRDKTPIVADLMQKYNISPKEIAYIGDDINDINPMLMVENRFTVPAGNKRVKEIDNIQITEALGGNGAFRELAEAVLESVQAELVL